jgi:DNA-binding beta-propeller fold protein YncE
MRAVHALRRAPNESGPSAARTRGRRVLPFGTASLALVAALSWVGTPASSAGLPHAAHPQIQVGGFPTGMSLDASTDTVYVGNGTDDNLSLITGRTCNSATVAGCHQHIVAVTAGRDPIGSVVDPATNTIYAINSSGSVAVINGRTCDAVNTTGCGSQPATIRVGSGPEFGAFDPTTRTLYVANLDGNTVSVVNVRSCNAEVVTGCARAVVRSVPSGGEPFAVAVDIPSNTIYVTNAGSGSVTVISGRTCNGVQLTGCNHISHEYVGTSPGGVAVDQKTNTVYVADQRSNDVAMFSGATCDSVNTTRCGQSAYRLPAGNGDRGIAVDDLTDSIYVANTNANTVLVFSGRLCNGTVHTACKVAFAHVGSSPRRVVVDETTNTVYVTNANSNTVTMLDGRTCNGSTKSGC